MTRFRLATAITAAVLSFAAIPANAADKVTVLTSWFAQAEHGGFYQAKAAGLYSKKISTSRSRWAGRRSTACSSCSAVKPT